MVLKILQNRSNIYFDFCVYFKYYHANSIIYIISKYYPIYMKKDHSSCSIFNFFLKIWNVIFLIIFPQFFYTLEFLHVIETCKNFLLHSSTLSLQNF